MTKFKIDLHTHSILSHKGGIDAQGYEAALSSGMLDFVAITDHDDLSLAFSLKQKHGEKIIVGQEIKTTDGDIVGLFLETPIASGKSITWTINQIKSQKGLVYLPHPFDTKRDGITKSRVDKIIDKIDIIEAFNARFLGFKGNSNAQQYAKEKLKPMGVGSDAYIEGELGGTYALISDKPTRNNLCDLLLKGELHKKYVLPWYYISTKYNRIGRQ